MTEPKISLITLSFRKGKEKMKRIISARLTGIFLIVLCCIYFAAPLNAQGPQPVSPTVTTLSLESMTSDSITVKGFITDEGEAPIQEKGVCWGVSANPDINGLHSQSDAPGNHIQVTITGLNAAEEYHVRVYATNSAGLTGYGEDKLFTIGIPSVTTLEATSIESRTATLAGSIDSDGGSSITEKGICWDTSGNPDITGPHLQNDTPGGDIQMTVTGLDPYTEYHFRAYATNSEGLTGYGEDKIFTTTVGSGDPPSVTTGEATAIIWNGATLGGSVDSNGGSSVREKGICWGTLANPDINGSHLQNDAPGEDILVTVTGLKSGTEHRFRAYATNSEGLTGYGEDKVFITAEIIAYDIDSNGGIDLRDAIVALQVLVGMNPSGVDVSGDVNDDGRIGIPEVVSILRKVTTL